MRFIRLIATTAVMLTLAACQPDELSDYDEDWTLNDDAETDTRQIFATCPNGGKVTPATPAFGKSIDGYASYDGQDQCSGSAKPGVTAFMNLVLKTYPCTHSGGIVRGCGVGGTSEHKEGRAWDWMIKVGHPSADKLLGWLLATDSHGNKHANARRVGIMYMIWNRKMWRAYNPGGWQTYTGSNPHTDHVHFSFSWKGANKQTSFWSAPAPAPTPPPPTPPPNDPPKGKLEQATCTGGIKGWAQDPNAPKTATSVQLYFDKTAETAGATATTVKANLNRADLCASLGSCEHGFQLDVPTGYRDGKKHTVYGYALDSATGKRALLAGSPVSFTCSTSTPPAPAPAPAPSDPPPAAEPPPSDPAPAEDALPNTAPAADSGDDVVVGGCSVVDPTGSSMTGTLGLLLILLTVRLTSSRRTRYR